MPCRRMPMLSPAMRQGTAVHAAWPCCCSAGATRLDCHVVFGGTIPSNHEQSRAVTSSHEHVSRFETTLVDDTMPMLPTYFAVPHKMGRHGYRVKGQPRTRLPGF